MPVYPVVQTCMGQEQADEDQRVDDRRANIGGTCLIWSAKSLGGCPDEERKQHADQIGQIAEQSKDEANRHRRLTRRHKISKQVWVHLDDANPEVNPRLDSSGLPIQ